MNTHGRIFRVTTFGESHGPAVGAVVDGCPAGVALDAARIQAALDRRRPGQSALTSARAEADRVEILSGVFEERTLGTPIALLVRNTDARPQDYDALRTADRRGHADAAWRTRFKHRDHRGGGRSSARETVGRVLGGAVAEALLARELPAARIVAWVSVVGALEAAAPADVTRDLVDAHPTRCPDPATREEMAAAIERARDGGDSLGGAVDLRVTGLPVGLGEPVFDKLRATLGAAMMSIPAVAGTWVGPSDLGARLRQPGSVFHADERAWGGIQGGMSNGAALELRVLFKPPATLGATARAGRHDPCVLPRAVPIVEAMAALVLADAWLHVCALPHRS
ncbi:MAG: chorismate synthase [Deltaproteobacteria bacterium]|nr:chorismate synthase [Deltaproteobacteria bacterium]